MSNALIMTGRSLRLTVRSPEALLTALMLPVMITAITPGPSRSRRHAESC
jgi:hypothetical protein